MIIGNKTFEKLVWELVKSDRETTMVVDNHHAYGIIKDRVDSFWEQVRLVQADEDQMMVLGGLIAIGAYAQLAAENLAFVPEQLGRDESADKAEETAAKANARFRELVEMLDNGKKRAKVLQRGVPRYVFEFDTVTLDALKAEVQ